MAFDLRELGGGGPVRLGHLIEASRRSEGRPCRGGVVVMQLAEICVRPRPCHRHAQPAEAVAGRAPWSVGAASLSLAACAGAELRVEELELVRRAPRHRSDGRKATPNGTPTVSNANRCVRRDAVDAEDLRILHDDGGGEDLGNVRASCPTGASPEARSAQEVVRVVATHDRSRLPSPCVGGHRQVSCEAPVQMLRKSAAAPWRVPRRGRSSTHDSCGKP